MSEHSPTSPEHHHEHKEHLPTAEHAPVHEKVREHHEAKQQAALEASRNAVKQEAISSSETTVDKHKEHDTKQLLVNQELKQLTFQRLLTRTRKHLSAPDKTLSKIVHQPAVDAVSQVGEKTIARPSGILGGSICAFLGSTVLLYMAKHYGFRYNFLFFVLLFIAGFTLGLLVELLIYALRRARTN